MYFEILGEVHDVETIARGHGVRLRPQLMKRYGGRAWRKLKGTVMVQLEDGSMRFAEVHWYECHGIGRKGWKIKRFLD